MEQLFLMATIGLVFGAFYVWGIFKENKELLSNISASNRRINELHSNIIKLQEELALIRGEKKSLSKRVSTLTECIEKKDELYNNLEISKELSFTNISSLMSDFLTLQYTLSADVLIRKKHPARKEAARIKELKNETKGYIQENRIFKYTYEYLQEVFPDLKPYIDDISSLEEIEKYDDLNDLTDTTDRVKNFLSSDEYKKLPEVERNQLALDRYLKGEKTNWQIGRDFEMFVGQQYEKNGWNVEYIGIEKKLNDMGRDIIAIKEGKTHIVQCKYWAKHKQIHENSITQLYGTTVHYKMKSNDLFESVTPVLVTNITLSETAKEFASYLGVEIRDNTIIEDFPRIKCKVGKDENQNNTKIYHLPMDQQYDKTKISSKNDCYTFTVRDANNKGFRRAYRWRSRT